MHLSDCKAHTSLQNCWCQLANLPTEASGHVVQHRLRQQAPHTAVQPDRHSVTSPLISMRWPGLHSGTCFGECCVFQVARQCVASNDAVCAAQQQCVAPTDAVCAAQHYDLKLLFAGLQILQNG